MELSGKNIVYVGGTGGIGLATSRLLIQKNIANLVLLDKHENLNAITELKNLNSKVNIYFLEYDVTKKVDELMQTFETILSKIHKFDILINGAGIFNDFLIEDTIRINLAGVINTSIVAIQLWDKSKGGTGGVIVNIASVAGLAPHPAIPVYCATKAGVITFTKSIAQLEGKTGITTFAICPGPTQTTMINQVNTFFNYFPEITALMGAAPSQSPEICAKNFVDVIEKNENGSIWILDEGRVNRLANNDTAWQSKLYDVVKN